MSVNLESVGPVPNPAEAAKLAETIDKLRHPGQGSHLALGGLLVDRGLIKPEQLSEVLEEQKNSGDRLGNCLVKQGLIDDKTLAEILSEQYQVPYLRLEESEPEPDTVRLISKKVALQCQAVPITRVGRSLSVAMVDPSNIIAIDELKSATGLALEVFVAPESQIRLAIQRFYDQSRSEHVDGMYARLLGDERGSELEVVEQPTDTVDVRTLESDSETDRIVHLANLILVDAIRKKASDIHLEPYDRELRLRFRVDGELVVGMNVPISLKDALTSRLKIMAHLNIAERRVPQDGRIRLRTRTDEGVKELDFRVSTLPTLFGEKVVMRLLDKGNLMFDMTGLGFEPTSLERLERAVAKPYGLILVTGPTGSGKTNTLYSAIARLNKPGVNILTAEDPVEFTMPGVNQVQIREQVGLTFAAALRSFLRQDPDVVLIGEIRDRETAEMAIKAALTGHLVLSTLHTNSAPATIDRLVNMGVDPFLIAAAVQLVCAQRLVRRICASCKTPTAVSPAILGQIGFAEEEVGQVQPYSGNGCSDCGQSGYKGRVGLYEVMETTDELRDLIVQGANVTDIRTTALQQGMVTLRRSGLEKIKGGVTTLEQVSKETIG